MTPNQQMNLQRKELEQVISKLEANANSELLKKINTWRKSVVYELANAGKLDVLTLETLKLRINALNDTVKMELTKLLSDNQRRLFIKGLQLVDKILDKGGIFTAVPYLDERRLQHLQNYSADLITGLTEEAKKSINTEIQLGVLGQKSSTDITKAIGSNLTDASVFGTIAKRASIIYQTELKRIQNQSTIDRMKQVKGQVPDMAKRWIHSHLGIPRPYHLMLDGITIEMNEKFSIRGRDGVTYEVDAPHDASLPAGEVVNCKCIVIPVVKRFLKK